MTSETYKSKQHQNHELISDLESYYFRCTLMFHSDRLKNIHTLNSVSRQTEQKIMFYTGMVAVFRNILDILKQLLNSVFYWKEVRFRHLSYCLVINGF